MLAVISCFTDCVADLLEKLLSADFCQKSSGRLLHFRYIPEIPSHFNIEEAPVARSLWLCLRNTSLALPVFSHLFASSQMTKGRFGDVLHMRPKVKVYCLLTLSKF